MRWPTRIAAIGLTAMLLALLARQVPVEQLRAVAGRLRPELLVAAGMFYLPVHLARAARFRLLLGPWAPATSALVPLSAAVSLLNHVLVSRAGDIAFVPLACRYEGVESGDALAAIGVSRLLDLLAVALLFLASAAWSLGSLPGRSDALLAAVALAGLAGAALWLLGPAARWLGRRLGQGPPVPDTDADGRSGRGRTVGAASDVAPTLRSRLHRTISVALDAVARLREEGAFRPALIATLLAWGLTFSWLWLLVGAVGGEVALAPFVVGATFGTIAKAAPLPTVGGHGLAEAGWALGFTAVLGWPLAEAVTVGLAVSALTVLFAALYGLPGLAWLARRGRGGGQRPESEATESGA